MLAICYRMRSERQQIANARMRMYTYKKTKYFAICYRMHSVH